MRSLLKFHEASLRIGITVICWLFAILLFARIGVSYLPNQHNFLGGGEKHYVTAPLFWGWSNFDGEHYISIARDGYRPLEYFFFPTYPLLIRYTTQYISHDTASFVFMGIMISLTSLILALIGISKLWKIDNPNSRSIDVILLFLLFPTSFYFFSVYTESLFLALSVWCFYFAFKKQFLMASLLALVASATKVIGFSLFAALFVEWTFQNWPMTMKRATIRVKTALPILIAPLGLFAYMFFLERTTGDPLVFVHQVGIFGAQRSNTIILLPQVFYRYIFKIIPSLTLYWPVIFTTSLEFVTGALFLVILLISIKKLRLSYLLFFIIGYLVPSFAGSFSSMPRYVLVLFPAFFVSAKWIQKLSVFQRVFLYTCLTVTLAIATALFIRGYWVS